MNELVVLGMVVFFRGLRYVCCFFMQSSLVSFLHSLHRSPPQVYSFWILRQRIVFFFYFLFLCCTLWGWCGSLHMKICHDHYWFAVIDDSSSVSSSNRYNCGSIILSWIYSVSLFCWCILYIKRISLEKDKNNLFLSLQGTSKGKFVICLLGKQWMWKQL